MALLPGRGHGARGTGSQQASQGVELCLGMLRTAVVGAHLGLLLAVGGAFLLTGPTAAANAALAAALVIVFFASGQGVQMVAGEMADGLAMGLVMVSFLARVAILGLLLALAMRHQDSLEAVFHRGAFMAGAVLALVGWLAGILVANARQRVYVYDADWAASRRTGGAK
ncbi:hypothetical protein [Luteococcus peritonei]